MQMKVIFITMVSLLEVLVLKKRHNELGIDLLSTTRGEDNVLQKRCLLLVQILTDSS